MIGEQLQIGARLPDWRGPVAEGARFQVDRAGVTLLHYYRGPTQREIEGARTGRMQLGLVRAGDHTLLLLYSIDGLTSEWSDAPFALGLVAPDRRDIEPRADDQGRLMLSILADADLGTVYALRAVSLTPVFSAALDDLLSWQRAALGRFSAAAHAAELQAAYARWPRSRDMVATAVAIERGGLEFGR